MSNHEEGGEQAIGSTSASTAHKFGSDGFDCPHCATYAQMDWHSVFENGEHFFSAMTQRRVLPETYYPVCCWAQCFRCKKTSLWVAETMVWPYSGPAPNPSLDMPQNIRDIYKEANTISNLSPRGAAALLRLAIQTICNDMNVKGNSLAQQIDYLVENCRLRPQIHQALHAVRIVGNDQVHPGMIDLQDNQLIMLGLFKMVNMIVEDIFTKPGETKDFLDGLPEKHKEKIRKRTSATSND